MATIDPKKALAEIATYFEKRDQALAAISESEAKVFLTQVCALIDQFAPPDSAYREAKDKALKVQIVGGGNARRSAMHLEEVDAILKAMEDDYANNRIELPQEVAIGAFTRIEQVLNRFHKVVRQLGRRHGGRTPPTIGDEYDVQDLLRALFSIDFEDVRSEEWTPSYAGSSGKRMDFLFKKHALTRWGCCPRWGFPCCSSWVIKTRSFPPRRPRRWLHSFRESRRPPLSIPATCPCWSNRRQRPQRSAVL